MARTSTLPVGLLPLLLACAVSVPLPVSAQDASGAFASPGPLGVTTTGTSVALRHGLLVAPLAQVAMMTREPLPIQDPSGINAAMVMMGIGSAALVAGLLIGGEEGFTIASVGGVVGMIGLYRYFR